MVQIVADLEGAKDVERMLKGLADEYGPKNAASAFNGAVRAAMKGTLDQIQRETPVDRGLLKDSVALKVGKPSKKRLRDSQFVDEFTVVEGRCGWFWKRGDAVNSFEALAVEFGTQTTPAQPTLRKALQNNAQNMVSTFAKEIGPQIEKKARSLGRRRSKGTLRRR